MRSKITNNNTVNLQYYNTKDFRIGMIIPVTSRKRNYKDVKDTDFYKILLTSFIETYNRSGKYRYNFYLGYDDDDLFFRENIENMKRIFHKVTDNRMGFFMIEMKNLQGKVGQIWSNLARTASKDCDYLYQIGDDIQIISPGWEDVFVEDLLEKGNIGVTGPYDTNQKNMLTQSFVHVTHLQIFGDYYPKEIDNWFIDNWITFIYKPTKHRNIKVKNSGGPPRYKPTINKNTVVEIVKKSRIILEEYLKSLDLETVVYKSDTETHYVSENKRYLGSNRVLKTTIR